MKLDKPSFDKYFAGFFIIDCVVRNRNILYFVIEEEYVEGKTSEPKGSMRTRVITCINMPGIQPWGYAELGGMQNLKAGVSFKPREQFVGVSLNDHVYVLGGGEKGLENDLKGGRNSAGKPVGMRGGVAKTKNIDGWLWLAGSGRTVGRRLEKNSWEWHDEIPHKSLMDDGGFLDIDGFSSSDIYAAGGHGDIWHFDGSKWIQLPFPSNVTLSTVCCAGNGVVYIGADEGTIYKGRGDRWQRIHVGDLELPFTDIVWHQNKLWCTNDYGLFVLNEDKLTRADVPDKIRTCSGHLSVGDGVMLLAGVYGAALHDGKSWSKIIDFNDLL